MVAMGSPRGSEPGRRPPAPAGLRLVQQFINTYNMEREHLGLPQDEFASPERGRRWLVTQGLLARGTPLGRGDIRRIRAVREALRRLVRAHNGEPAAGRAAAGVLNRLAAEAGFIVRVRRDGRMFLDSPAGGVAGALGRLVAAAFTAQVGGTWPRLKACRRCQWAFYDRSKNRSGQWCAMSICGNRMKAQAYRARRRGRVTPS
jgi:predicted RNA-binding Zn ribbon-like protein